jgi:hypothetical protein
LEIYAKNSPINGRKLNLIRFRKRNKTQIENSSNIPNNNNPSSEEAQNEGGQGELIVENIESSHSPIPIKKGNAFKFIL